MIAALFALTLLDPALQPVEFELGFKKGQRLTYEMKWYSPNGGGGTYSGELVLEVTGVDDKGFTIMCSAVESAPKGERPGGGEARLLRDGTITHFSNGSSTASVLIGMLLPSAPIEVSGEYKVKSKFRSLDLDLTGKLVAIDGANAKFHLVGSMGSQHGFEQYEFDIKSVFDRDRGLFTSIRMDIVQEGPGDSTSKHWASLRLLKSE